VRPQVANSLGWHDEIAARIANMLTPAIRARRGAVVPDRDCARRHARTTRLQRSEPAYGDKRADRLERHPHKMAVVDQIPVCTMIDLVLAEHGTEGYEIAALRDPRA
jgi:hypothetical protein